MTNTANSFPQFRAYSNRQVFFKILNTSSLEELKLFGQNYSLKSLQATTWPDRLMIEDLLHVHHQTIEVITEDEYETILLQAQQTLKRIDL